MNIHSKNNITKESYKITIIGLIVNFFLTILKFIVGAFGKSSALIADATHSLSDVLSDFIVLFFIGVSSRPNDEKHRYGHGKFETFSTFIVGVLLAIVGVGILWDATIDIYNYFNGIVPESPKKITILIIIISLFVKELLFWITLKIGKKINSKMIIANAWHHRSDAFSSIAVLFGVAGAIYLGEKWRILDPISASIVSLFIIYVAYKIFMPAVNDLLEQSIPKEESKEVINIINSVDGINNSHNLKTRRLGNNYAIEVHVYVDKNLSVEKAHDLTVIAENKLLKRFGEDTHIVIHVEPEN